MAMQSPYAVGGLSQEDSGYPVFMFGIVRVQLRSEYELYDRQTTEQAK